MADTFDVCLDIYGFVIAISSEDRDSIQLMRQDFRFFECAGGKPPAISISMCAQKADFSLLPDVPASIYTRDYTCYQTGQDVYTDYHGGALRIYRAMQHHYQIQAENRDMRYEICYLTVLATAGRHLDARHLHRVHALGFTHRARGVLVLLPEKGGKTTLALHLLKSGTGQLLSDESPLINRRGEALPFPLRLGIVTGSQGEADIPQQYRYAIDFMGVGSKTLVDPQYFWSRIASPCRVNTLLIGRRVLGVESRIRRCGKRIALKEFMQNAVVGMGLHQGLEFFFGHGLRRMPGNCGVAFSRLYNSLQVIRHSKVYLYDIGHDIELNFSTLQNFLLGDD